MNTNDDRWQEFFNNQFLKIESRLDALFLHAENQDKMRYVKPSLRSLRRYIEALLGERDDCCELLPDDIHKAPAFCRSECAGNGPHCGGCSHGGYGPGEAEASSLYRITTVVKREAN